jgi:integral membrane protein
MVPPVTEKSMRWIALAEATTFLALLVAAVVKRTADNEIGVQILGPIHGLLFIAYVVNVFSIREQLGWSGKTTFWVLVGAVVPFGGYIVDWWMVREARERTAT